MESDPNDVPNLDALANKVQAAKARALSSNNQQRNPAVSSRSNSGSSVGGAGNRRANRASNFTPRQGFSGGGVVGRSTSNGNNRQKRQHTENAPAIAIKRGKHTENDNEKPNWKQMKQEKKALKANRKKNEKGAEVYSLEREAKHIWEDLRRKDCTQERQWQLSSALWDLIKYHIPSMIVTHDMSRVIETLMVKGTAEMRDHIINLYNEAPHLSWTKYSNHVVLKTLVHATPEQKKLLYRLFIPHFCIMMTQPRSREMCEIIFEGVNTEQHRLKCIGSAYGQYFRDVRFLDVYGKMTYPTAAVWAGTNERYMKELKADFQKLFGNMFHRDDPVPLKHHFAHFFLNQYLTILSSEERESVIDELKLRESVVDIIRTKTGSSLMMSVFWQSFPKERKAMLKSLKGKITGIACNQHGYFMLLAILDSMDDTTMSSKVIVTELIRNITTVMGNLFGRKVIRYLIDRRNKTDFSPEAIVFLSTGDDARNKKDYATRCAEIHQAANTDLLQAVLENAKNWVKSSQSASVVMSIMMNCNGPKLELAALEIAKQVSFQPTFMTIQNGGTFAMVKKLLGYSPKLATVQPLEDQSDEQESSDEENEMDRQNQCRVFVRALVDNFTKKSMNDWLESPQGCALLNLIFQTWEDRQLRNDLFAKVQLCPFLEILKKEMATVQSKRTLHETLKKITNGLEKSGLLKDKNGKVVRKLVDSVSNADEAEGSSEDDEYHFYGDDESIGIDGDSSDD